MLARIVGIYFHKGLHLIHALSYRYPHFTGEVPTTSKLNLRGVPRP